MKPWGTLRHGGVQWPAVSVVMAARPAAPPPVTTRGPADSRPPKRVAWATSTNSARAHVPHTRRGEDLPAEPGSGSDAPTSPEVLHRWHRSRPRRGLEDDLLQCGSLSTVAGSSRFCRLILVQYS